MSKLSTSQILSAVEALEKSSLNSAISAVDKLSAQFVRNVTENSAIQRAMEATEGSAIQRAMEATGGSAIQSALEASKTSAIQSALEASKTSAIQSALQASRGSELLSALQANENSAILKARVASQNALQTLDSLSALKASLIDKRSTISNVLKSLNSHSNLSIYTELASTFSTRHTGALSLSEAYQEVIKELKESHSSNSDEQVDLFCKQVIHDVSESPLNSLSAEFYLSLILTLFLFVISQASSTDSENRILEKLESLEPTTTSQLAVFKKGEKTRTFYVVKREVKLYLSPTSEFGSLATIYPNQKVELIERASKWIKIEYFDSINNKSISGWVLKKRLKILNPQFSRENSSEIELMDRHIIKVANDDWNEFEEWLNAPPEEKPTIKKLSQSKPIWEEYGKDK